MDRLQSPYPLLLLIHLTGASIGGTEQKGAIKPYGPPSVSISGFNIVTVGIPYGFQCSADCFPQCRFRWTWGKEVFYGRDLNLELDHLEPTQVLTCTAVNPASGAELTVKKILKVTAGPSDILIKGPGYLTRGSPSVFNCSAECFPSCHYTWTVKWKRSVLETVEGSSITVRPKPDLDTETIICQAQNNVSHLYIFAAWTDLPVAYVSDVYITGPDTVTMGQTVTFLCSSTCNPSCDYTWRFRNQTYDGDQIQLPILYEGDKLQFGSKLVLTIVDKYTKTSPLVCRVRNDVSQEESSATKELSVIDPISVRPASGSQPVSGESFTLLCMGAQNRSNITWQRNGRPLITSDGQRLSSDGATLAFRPLQRRDGGSYQCVLTDMVGSIESAGYNLTVLYGPGEVTMVDLFGGIVGKQMFAVPGSKTELRCSAYCFPACTYTWLYGGELLSANATVIVTPTKRQNQTTLKCMALNPATKRTNKTQIVLIEPEGPGKVQISGPGSFQVGVTAHLRCLAKCVPTCHFTWTVDGNPVVGSDVEITPSHYIPTTSISCRAENAITGKTAAVNKTLKVSDPLWCGC